MNDIAIKRNDFDLIKRAHYPDASDESVALAIRYCEALALDPMQHPLHIVPSSFKDKSGTYQKRDTIMNGIGFYRIIAARTGQYAGIDEPIFGDLITETLSGVEVTYPEFCKVTVYRMIQGTKCAFAVKEFWKENYAKAGRSTEAPNLMWATRPSGQLAKCAESQALRKAFPEVGSVPTFEEMQGKDIIQPTNITEQNKPQPIMMTEEHGMAILDKCADLEVAIEDILKLAKVESLRELEDCRFDAIMKFIQAKSKPLEIDQNGHE